MKRVESVQFGVTFNDVNGREETPELIREMLKTFCNTVVKDALGSSKTKARVGIVGVMDYPTINIVNPKTHEVERRYVDTGEVAD